MFSLKYFGSKKKTIINIFGLTRKGKKHIKKTQTHLYLLAQMKSHSFMVCRVTYIIKIYVWFCIIYNYNIIFVSTYLFIARFLLIYMVLLCGGGLFYFAIHFRVNNITNTMATMSVEVVYFFGSSRPLRMFGR